MKKSEFLLLIRGYKKTGKSTLIKRMKSKPFSESYVPTSVTQIEKIRFFPENDHEVSIVLMEAITQNPVIEKTQYGNPSGLVLLYNPQNIETVKFCLKIISSFNQFFPIALISNFYDQHSLEIHPSLKSLQEKAYHISMSLKTNYGLKELSNWLKFVHSFHIRNFYLNLLQQTEKEIEHISSSDFESSSLYTEHKLSANLKKSSSTKRLRNRNHPSNIHSKKQLDLKEVQKKVGVESFWNDDELKGSDDSFWNDSTNTTMVQIKHDNLHEQDDTFWDEEYSSVADLNKTRAPFETVSHLVNFTNHIPKIEKKRKSQTQKFQDDDLNISLNQLNSEYDSI
jgi:GTPase SAR1 family protein